MLIEDHSWLTFAVVLLSFAIYDVPALLFVLVSKGMDLLYLKKYSLVKDGIRPVRLVVTPLIILAGFVLCAILQALLMLFFGVTAGILIAFIVLPWLAGTFLELGFVRFDKMIRTDNGAFFGLHRITIISSVLLLTEMIIYFAGEVDFFKLDFLKTEMNSVIRVWILPAVILLTALVIRWLIMHFSFRKQFSNPSETVPDNEELQEPET